MVTWAESTPRPVQWTPDIYGAGWYGVFPGDVKLRQARRLILGFLAILYIRVRPTRESSLFECAAGVYNRYSSEWPAELVTVGMECWNMFQRSKHRVSAMSPPAKGGPALAFGYIVQHRQSNPSSGSYCGKSDDEDSRDHAINRHG